MQTLFNGAEVFTNGDPYNLADDVAKAFKSVNTVIRVSSLSERDSLAAAAPGGVLPVPTVVFRTDLDRTETWNGTEWAGNVRHVEYGFPSASAPNNTPWGPGVGVVDAARSLYPSFASMSSNDVVTVNKSGLYTFNWYMNWGGTQGPCFFALDKNGNHFSAEQKPSAYEHSHTLASVYLSANEQIRFIFVQTSGTSITASHRIRVTRLA